MRREARKRGRRLGTVTTAIRRRLQTTERREQILGNATHIIGRHGLTLLSVERLARSCGVSKALIYVHFARQGDILSGVLQREYERLSAAGLDEALRLANVEDALVSASAIYVRQISNHGTVLHALLADPLFAAQMRPRDRVLRDRVMNLLVRRLHRELGFAVKHAGFAVSLLAAIPESAGRMAFEGRIDLPLAEELCADLVRSSLRALVEEISA